MIRIMKYGETPNAEIFARTMPTVNVADKVAEIIRNVRERGDKALREKLDGVSRREKFRIRYYNLDPSLIHLEKKRRSK